MPHYLVSEGMDLSFDGFEGFDHPVFRYTPMTDAEFKAAMAELRFEREKAKGNE